MLRDFDPQLNFARNRGWLLMLLIIGTGLTALSVYLYSNTGCQRFTNLVLIIWSIIVILLLLLFAFFARDNGIIIQVFSVVLLGIALILLPSRLLSAAENSFPQLVNSLCPVDTCERVEQANELLKTGEYSAAEQTAKLCIEETNDLLCQTKCYCQLAEALFHMSGEALQEKACSESLSYFNEAATLNSQYDCDLDLGISEREQRITEICATPTPTFTPTNVPPTPTSTPTPIPLNISLLRTNYLGNTLEIDVRVSLGSRPMTGIPKEDFEISIDGEVVEISDFKSITADEPSCIVATVDTSGSVRDGANNIQAGLSILSENQQAQDAYGLVTFSERTRVEIIQPLSTETELDGEQIEISGNYTALWDGVSLALDTIDENCPHNNRYILLMTDGRDNHSNFLRGYPEETRAGSLVERARELNTRICTLAIESEQLKAGKPYLTVLSQATGCELFTAEDYDAIASKVQEIVGDIEDFYRLSIPINLESESTYVLYVRVLETTRTFGFSPPQN